MSQSYRTIKIKKYLDVIIEAKASGAITPGHLVEQTSASTTTVRKHASADTFAFPMFALEDALQGKGIDDAYATGDQVQVWIPTRGDIVYALLQDNASVTIGDKLVSAGDGTLVKSLDTVASYESVEEGGAPFLAGKDLSFRTIIGVALDTLDLTVGGGNDSSALGSSYPRIRVRIY